MHTAAFILIALWLVLDAAPNSADPTVTVVVLASSPFLVLGPTLIAAWEHRLHRLGASIGEGAILDPDASSSIALAVARFSRLRPLIVVLPLALVAVAYIAGDEFFGGVLDIPREGVLYYLGFAIFLLGGLAAGWGVWSAIVTLWISLVLPGHASDFAPFAGTASKSSKSIGSFCVFSALAFGLGAAVLLPGLCAAAWQLDDVALAALLVAIGMIVGVTVALLAVPAAKLSQTNDDARVAFLNQLGTQIDDVADAATRPSEPFTGTQYARLRALLELRAHVTEHTMSQPSIELVKRIPAAVVLPVASILASWLSLVSG